MVDYTAYYKVLMDDALKRKDLPRALDYALLVAQSEVKKKPTSSFPEMVRQAITTLTKLVVELE